jgi:hypothetical protein
MPKHPRESPRPCPGSYQLPFEKDVSIAEAYLEKIKNNKNKEIDGRKITLTFTKNLSKTLKNLKILKFLLGIGSL